MKKFAVRSKLKSHTKILEDPLRIIHAELINILILSKEVHFNQNSTFVIFLIKTYLISQLLQITFFTTNSMYHYLFTNYSSDQRFLIPKSVTLVTLGQSHILIKCLPPQQTLCNRTKRDARYVRIITQAKNESTARYVYYVIIFRTVR